MDFCLKYQRAIFLSQKFSQLYVLILINHIIIFKDTALEELYAFNVLEFMCLHTATLTYITTIKKYFNKVDNTRQIGD